jgi:hypothetical protein
MGRRGDEVTAEVKVLDGGPRCSGSLRAFGVTGFFVRGVVVPSVDD